MLYTKRLGLLVPTIRILQVNFSFHLLKYSEEDKLRIRIKQSNSIHKLKQLYLSQIKRFSPSIYAVTCHQIVEVLTNDNIKIQGQDAQFLDIFIQKLKNLDERQMTPKYMASIVEMNQLFMQKSHYYNKSLQQLSIILNDKLSSQSHLQALNLKQLSLLYTKLSTKRKETKKLRQKMFELLKNELSTMGFLDSQLFFIFQKIFHGMKQSFKLCKIQVQILEVMLTFIKEVMIMQLTPQQIGIFALYLNQSIFLQGIAFHCVKLKQIQHFETIQKLKSITLENIKQLNSGWILFALKYRTFLEMNVEQKVFYEAILANVQQRMQKLDLSNSVEAQNLFYYLRQLNKKGIKYPIQDHQRSYSIILNIIKQISQNRMDQLNNLVVKLLYDQFFPEDLTKQIFKMIRVNPSIPWKFNLLHYFLTNSDKDLTEILLAKISTCRYSIQQRTLDNQFFAMASLVSQVSKLNPNNVLLKELKTSIDTRILALNRSEINLIITCQNKQVIEEFHKHYGKLYFAGNLEPYLKSKNYLLWKYFGYLFRTLSPENIDKSLLKFQLEQKLEIIVHHYRHEKVKGSINEKYIQKLLELFDIVLDISDFLKNRGLFKQKTAPRNGFLDLIQELHSYQMLKIVLFDRASISYSYMRIIIKIIYIYKNFELSFEEVAKNLLLDLFLNPHFEYLRRSTLFLELLYEHFAEDYDFLNQFSCATAYLITNNIIRDYTLIESMDITSAKSILHKCQVFRSYHSTTLQLQFNEVLSDQEIDKIMQKVKLMRFQAIQQCIICFNLKQTKKSSQLIKLLCSQYQRKFEKYIKPAKIAALLNNFYAIKKRFKRHQDFYEPMLLAIQKNCFFNFKEYHLKDHLQVLRQLQMNSIKPSQAYCQKICDVLLKYYPNIINEIDFPILFSINPRSILDYFKSVIRLK